MENREERITLKPDNHDMRLKYYELILESRGLAELPCYPPYRVRKELDTTLLFDGHILLLFFQD